MKTLKYRFYPTAQQKQLLAESFGCARFVWNNILDWRSKEYTQNKTKIGYSKTSKRLTDIKNEFPFLKDVSSVVLQQSLRNQDTAFQNFFSGRAKYPNFKKKFSKQSIRLVSSAFKIKGDRVFIAKSKEPLSIEWSRELTGHVSSITISKDKAERYFVCFVSDTTPELKPVAEKNVGLDWGLNDFITTSKGDKYKPLKATKKYENKLAKAQKNLAKKKKGSNNRNKARVKVAKIHAKIADTRKDYLHKLSTKLINENQVISIEDINISGLIRNRKLSKSIADSSWNMFVSQLEYKANWYGRTVSKISRWFPSSQICSCCGYRSGRKALDIRDWTCPECNTVHDRDVNAAINIDTVGLTEINACGVAGSGTLACR